MPVTGGGSAGPRLAREGGVSQPPVQRAGLSPGEAARAEEDPLVWPSLRPCPCRPRKPPAQEVRAAGRRQL